MEQTDKNQSAPPRPVAPRPERSSMKAICIDFETANRSPRSACALGVTELQDGQVTGTWYTLIRPHPDYGLFEPFNIRIHGIRPSDVQNAPTFADFWTELAPRLDGAFLAAHNAAFDIGMLTGILDLYGLDYPRVPYLCTCKLARRVWPHLPNHKLGTLAAHLNHRFVHHHAGEDATACGRVLTACLQDLGIQSWEALPEGTPLNPGHLWPGGHEPCRVRPRKRS